MSNPYAFISACDTPFLKKEVVDIVTTGIGPDIDIVIPQTAAGLEPLCAAYSKNCIDPAERALASKKCKIQEIFKKRRIKKVSEAALRKKDPDLLSFFNVNTPADLKRAEKIHAAVKRA
jgi:molybdopterin-guanine dinucleotide biosynthesis protein A